MWTSPLFRGGSRAIPSPTTRSSASPSCLVFRGRTSWAGTSRTQQTRSPLRRSSVTEHDVLVATKSYLLNHGWQQGSYGAPGGPRCMLGAIGSACGLKSSESDAFDDEDRPRVMTDAARLLKNTLGCSIFIWN